jgi:peptide/nickel transport system permease protein
LASYVVRRLIQTIFVIILVSLITFSLMQIVPGDPVVAMLGSTVAATPEQIQLIRHELWLDRPMAVQYIHWVNGAIHGDFGKSIYFRSNVTDLLAERLPRTMYLAVIAFIISIVLGIAAGIISAIRRGGWLDNIVSLFANIGVGIPVFWLGIVGIFVFGLKLHWLPIFGYTSPTEDFILSTRQAIMPIICLAVPLLAVLTRQTRSSMLEVIRQDYIRTARSKGLRERIIVFRHALKNAFIPVITLIGLNTRVLIGGSVLVESVFNIPGVGRLLAQSAIAKDFLVIQGGVLLLSVIVCLANLAVDISYVWFDPRIRYD